MKTRLFVLVVALGACAATRCFAEEAEHYVGVSYGQSTFKDGCNALPAGSSCDKTDTSWRFFAGFGVARNFGVEFGYSDRLGRAAASSATASATADVRAFDLAGIASLPLAERFFAYGRVGLYTGETTLSGSGTASASRRHSGLTFGAGLRYDFTRSVAARADWQRYDSFKDYTVGGSVVSSKQAEVLSLGMLFKF